MKHRSSRGRRAARLGAGAGILLAVATAGGFVTLDGDGTKWTRNPTFRILNGSPDIPDTSDDRAIRDSFAAWQGVSGSSLAFREVNSGEDISVEFLTQWPREIGATAAGVTFTRRSRGVISSAEISINNQHFNWTTTNNGDDADVQGVTTHEVGHAIGLGHTYERDAVMYWSGSGVELRALQPDDQRGARFLYGNRAGLSGMCDTCLAATDCAAGGVCIALEPSMSFCGQPCAGGCPDGTTCFELQNGGQQCLPTIQFCSDDGGTGLALGDYCWGAAQCGPGLDCLPIPDGPALCSRACTSDAQCTNGTRCASGFCLSGGDGAFGDDCQNNLDCASLICVPLDDTTNLCMEGCDPLAPRCPAQADCVPLEDAGDLEGICVPPGDVPEGGACGAERCGPGLTCILESEDAGVCRAACDPFGTCRQGRGCTPFSGDSWFCLPSGAVAEGGDCDPSATDCRGGLLCLPLDDQGNGMCLRPCDDADADFCGGDVACLDIDEDAGNLGICSPGDAGFAEPCATSLECRSFICVADGDGGSCTQPCQDTCPEADWICANTQSGDRLCFPQDEVGPGPNPDPEPEIGPGPDAEPEGNPEGAPEGEPGPGGFINDGDEPEGGFINGGGADAAPKPGCQSPPGAPGAPWPLLLLLAALAATRAIARDGRTTDRRTR